MEIDRAKIFRSFANRITNNAKECRDDDGKKEKNGRAISREDVESVQGYRIGRSARLRNRQISRETRDFNSRPAKLIGERMIPELPGARVF